MQNCLIFLTLFISILYCIEIKAGAIPEQELSEKNEDTKNIKLCDVKLNFSSMGLEIINRNFIDSSSVTYLTLHNNRIEDFEKDTFSSLPNLEYLDLSSNRLTTENLFSFGEISSLKTLILDDNSYFIDDYQCPLDDYFERNEGCGRKYSSFKVAYYYPEVTYLSIRKNYINSFSSEWKYNFPKVESLDASENNFEESFDYFVQTLPISLTTLILEQAGLTSIETQRLENITVLNLNNNYFETLSSHHCYEKTLCLKGLNNLQSLLVSSCAINEIETNAFKEMEKLVHLDISNNKFTEIPDGAFDYIPSLSTLDISQNSINSMPDISILQNLKKLVVNDMKKYFLIRDLEASSPMPSIEVISFRNNGLTTISSSFLDNFPNLREIDLSNNLLVSLPSGTWQGNLQKLHLNGNIIHDIEDLSLTGATSLELLELELNPLSRIKLSTLRDLPENVVLKL